MSKLHRMLLLLACLVLLPGRMSWAADVYSVGQKVEVREGDSWSPASVIGHEGRKYQVHYEGSDASTDEWVTTDRLRKPLDASGAPVATPVAASEAATNSSADDAAATSQPAGADNSKFKVGDSIEAKWGGLWRKASVAKKSGKWTLVEYNKVWFEWVQPWRLRALGSKEDTDLDSSPRSYVKIDEPAPKESPEAASKTADASHRHGRRGAAGDAAAPDEGSDHFHISETTGPGGIAITKVDLSGHDIGVSEVSGVAAPDAPPMKIMAKRIVLDRGKPMMGARPDVLTAPQSKFAIFSAKSMSPDDAATFQRIDLATGTAGKMITLPAGVMPMAISADGKRLATHSDRFFGGTKWRVDLWSIESDTPKPLLSFRAYPMNTMGNDEVLWGSYLDATHLLTCSGKHELSLWDISDTGVKLVYTLAADSTVTPKLSAGGKYFLAGYGGQAIVCDAMSGNCVAKCSAISDVDRMNGALTSDISKLALCSGSRLIVCDLKNDKVLSNVGLPIGVAGTDVQWLNANLLLIDHRWVYDAAHNATAWEYTMAERRPMIRSAGDRLLVMEDENDPTLTVVNPLSSQVVAADQKLADGVPVISAGAKVALQINAACPPDQKQKIVDVLTRRLQKAGFIVADDQPIVLVADSKSANEHQVTYRSQGSFNTETVTVANTVESLTFVVNSKPVWSVSTTSFGNAPPVLFHKSNESVAQALDEQKRPKWDWYGSVGIPPMVLKAMDPAGSSRLGG